jgi:hypothetical protein
MRTPSICLALVLAACTDDPEAQIIAPISDTTVYATVELRMRGHLLTETTHTKIYVDRAQHTGELVNNTLPEDCDEECSFVISFAGASIPNGPHTVAVYFYADDNQLATDVVPLVFAR